MNYRAIYDSAVSSTTGCNQKLFSQKLPQLRFPPNIDAFCELCKKRHSFRFTNAMSIPTPSAQRHFEKYCSQHSIQFIEIEF